MKRYPVIFLLVIIFSHLKLYSQNCSGVDIPEIFQDQELTNVSLFKVDADTEKNIYYFATAYNLQYSEKYLLVKKYSIIGEETLLIQYTLKGYSEVYIMGADISSEKNIIVLISGTVDGPTSDCNISTLIFSSEGELKKEQNLIVQSYGLLITNLYVDSNNEILLGYSNEGNGFVTKLSSNADSLWTTKLPGDEFNSINISGIITDSSNNIFIKSYSINGIEDPPTPRGLIYKLSQSGALLWKKGTETEDIHNLFFDKEEDIIFTTKNKITKIDTTGDITWTINSNVDIPMAAAIDHDNNIIIVGIIRFVSSVIDDNYLTQKVSSNGNELWNRQLNSIDGQEIRDIPTDLIIDEHNNIYITGHSNHIIEGTQVYDKDFLFTVKYDSDGNEKAKLKFECSDFSFPNEYTYKLLLDNNGDLFLGGGIHAKGNYGSYGFFFSKISADKLTNIKANSSPLPQDYSLKQNYPNPFNANTKIKFTLPTSENVILEVYDMLGSKVCELISQYLEQGTYTVDFNAETLSSSIYFYSLKTKNYSKVMKATLLK